MLLATPDTQSDFAFDAAKENIGMVVVGIIILVVWLAFRKMLELSERRGEEKKEPPKEG